jgi:F-type H+-transporting ATPase subunit delta
MPSKLSERYARALFATALKKNALEPLDEDFEQFLKILEAQPEFKSFILSPPVYTRDKRALITNTLGETAHPILTQFLLLLVDKKRFQYVEEMAEEYKKLYEGHIGVVEVKVITAVPLDNAPEQKLIAKLEAQTNKKIRLKKSVDPRIIGGMILVMENKIIDGSVKSNLEKFKSNLRAVKIH